jgi:hypothetical protein
MTRDDERYGRRERHEYRGERGRQDLEHFRGMERDDANRYGAREEESRGFYDAGGRGDTWTSREPYGREGQRSFQDDRRYGQSQSGEERYGDRQGTNYGMSGGSPYARDDEQRGGWGREDDRVREDRPRGWTPESERAYGRPDWERDRYSQRQYDRERMEAGQGGWQRERATGGGYDYGQPPQRYGTPGTGSWGVSGYSQGGGYSSGAQGTFGFTGQGQDRFTQRFEPEPYTPMGYEEPRGRESWRAREHYGTQWATRPTSQYAGPYDEGRRDARDWEGAQPQWRSERGFGHTGREDDRSVWQKMKDTFSGKGPRGYRRSDERIREDVSDRLTDHPGIDASDIDVDVRGGEVTLKGTVTSRDQKRMAEDVIESCPGVGEVHNQLRVQREHSGTQWSSSGVGAMAGTSTYYGTSGGSGENVMSGASGMSGATGLRSTTGVAGQGAVTGSSTLPGSMPPSGAFRGTRDQLREGTAVVDSEGKRIGTVRSKSEDHFDVEREGKGNLHIPFDNVREMRGELAMLDRKADEIDKTGWDRAPVSGGTPRER